MKELIIKLLLDRTNAKAGAKEHIADAKAMAQASQAPAAHVGPVG